METAKSVVSEEIGTFLDTIPERIADELLAFIGSPSSNVSALRDEQSNVAGLIRLIRSEVDPERQVDLLLRHLDLPTCAVLVAVMLARHPTDDQRRVFLASRIDSYWAQPWAAEALLLLGITKQYEELLGARELQYDDVWIDADMALGALGAVLYRNQNELALPLIRLALGFPDHRVRFAAADLLTPQWVDEAVMRVLLDAVESDGRSNQDRLEKAFRDLLSISPEAVQRVQPQTLMRCSMHASPAVRCAAITALAVCGKDQSGLRQRLERIRTKDTRPEIRTAAMETLIALDDNPAQAEQYFSEEFQRLDCVLLSQLMDFLVNRCGGAASIMPYLFIESVGATATNPWRRFWGSIAKFVPGT